MNGIRRKFSVVELRVLACLMEKQLTTPNNYPLSINALMNACNQKSSREPVLSLTEGEVGKVARDLVMDGFCILQNAERSQRVEHKLTRLWSLSQQQQSILTVLLLRQPQTLNDIKVRTARMHAFDGLEEIQVCLNDWAEQEDSWVISIPASGACRATRYFHLLGEQTAEEILLAANDVSSTANGSSVSPTACRNWNNAWRI